MQEGEGLRGIDVVEGSDDRGLDEFLQQSLGRRHDVRMLRIPGQLLSRLDRDHQGIMGSMVASLELEILRRPVTARARRTANSVASRPVMENFRRSKWNRRHR